MDGETGRRRRQKLCKISSCALMRDTDFKILSGVAGRVFITPTGKDDENFIYLVASKQ